MCTPQLINDTAQFVAEQRALDAGIHPDDARANGGQYGLLPRQPVVVPANVPAPSPSAMGAAGSQIANAIANSGMLGNAGPKVQHMMMQKHESYDPPMMYPTITRISVPKPYIQSSPTVGELLGNKYGAIEEVGGPGSFRNLNVPLR